VAEARDGGGPQDSAEGATLLPDQRGQVGGLIVHKRRHAIKIAQSYGKYVTVLIQQSRAAVFPGRVTESCLVDSPRELQRSGEGRQIVIQGG